MIVNVLKSVEEMLSNKPNKSKVECARIILKQIIEYLDKNPTRIEANIPITFPADEGLSPEAQQAQRELMS